VSGEGQSGLAKRVAALASDFALTKDSPFIYMRTMPRLLDPQEVGDFIEALFVECSHRLDETGIKVIAFDTFNRALVGGNENDGRDVGRLLHADERIKGVQLRHDLRAPSREGRRQ
jgi:hypothetical protein